ncbi:sugar phosphate isomerase/epimerase family protein [Lichenibacterium ramalinae]|uniref:Sugar phosphate isomerase/epimerase n=1 Tax=Lichenibacterium ramalinae TaxID=2316527 RepID=A0A4Q2RG87_9HYPH|nr:sugar phosphate isomerase/epimerase family protein [Lichenibacterium ramalinae]RYB06425.1 sugar phosphate isomerase/epimerase [Lichenibacterium ramalinae]
MALRFAYNTNGTASHRLDDALMMMAETGYAGVALTLDHNHFDPFAKDWEADAKRLSQRLRGLGFGSVIETGARYLLDPRQKHEPTLVTADPAGRARRIAFLHRAIDVGSILGSEAVSFWAGVPKPGVDPDEAWDWLRAGLEQVVAYAGRRGVVAALEPEPGMLVETVDDYRRLAADIPGLKLALDTGHLLVTGEREPAAAIAEFKDQLGTVTIEDMKRGEHVHLPFGEGDMDVPGVLDALDAAGFRGLVCVELSRDSHRADLMMPEAFSFLRLCRQNVRAAPKPAPTASRVDALS